jgi:Domain of unknown function (DUF4440)
LDLEAKGEAKWRLDIDSQYRRREMNAPEERATSRASAQLLDMERVTVEAFKRKDDDAFTRHFAHSYIGIANDGIKGAADEVAGMRKLDIADIRIENETVVFPAENVGLVTYTMVVDGSLKGKDISGSIHTSTVYIHQEGEWKAVLHTESSAPADQR